MKDIVIYFVLFYLGLCMGWFFHWWVINRRSYNGVMFVEKDEDNILYSLLLTDDPETLQYKKQIIFQVDTSEKES